MTRDMDAEADAFVLGLMDEADESRSMADLSSDPDWARAVGRARDRFLPIDLMADAAPVPADLVQRVTARLSEAPSVAANLPGPPRMRRLLPAAAAIVALACGIGIGSRMSDPDPVVVAVLLDDGGVPRAIVEDYGSEHARIRFVSDIAVPDGRQMQVWTLPSQDMGPISLGLLETDRAERLSPPDLPTPAGGQLYEITLEPEGGSPTGRPTGPILAKGLAAVQDGV
ncbi:anti-sigma factor [Cereibacter sp. SYSU M97828]|nr:anti-sigma factor [Cereibacter flavus]